MVPVATVGVAVTLVILSALVVQQRGGLGPDQRSEMLKGESSSVICNFKISPKLSIVQLNLITLLGVRLWIVETLQIVQRK